MYTGSVGEKPSTTDFLLGVEWLYNLDLTSGFHIPWRFTFFFKESWRFLILEECMQNVVAVVKLTRHSPHGVSPVQSNNGEKKGRDCHNDQKTWLSSRLKTIPHVSSPRSCLKIDSVSSCSVKLGIIIVKVERCFWNCYNAHWLKKRRAVRFIIRHYSKTT